MKNAEYHEKDLVVDILAKSFEANQSVNYIIKQDAKKSARIRALMDYSFDFCSLFGEVFISDDKKGCALIVYPDQKKTTLKSILLDVKLILNCVGFRNIKKTLSREALIKKLQPNELMTYLWFIGVEPESQSIGIGSSLLQAVIQYSDQKGRPICLETSTVKNVPWYQKFGFKIYNEYDLSYHLYFFKRSSKNQ